MVVVIAITRKDIHGSFILSLKSPVFFFFNDTATTEIYTLSLHDALPIYRESRAARVHARALRRVRACDRAPRSEEHTSELQSHSDLVCRLLLEKKKCAFSLCIFRVNSPINRAFEC